MSFSASEAFVGIVAAAVVIAFANRKCVFLIAKGLLVTLTVQLRAPKVLPPKWLVEGPAVLKSCSRVKIAVCNRTAHITFTERDLIKNCSIAKGVVKC